MTTGPRSTRLLLGTAALVAIVALLGACGSDDDTADPASAIGSMVVLGQESLLADVLSLGFQPVAAGANVPQSGFQGLGDPDTSDIEVLDLLNLSIEQIGTLEADTIVTLDLFADLAGGAELLEGLADRVIIVPDNLEPAEKLTLLGAELGARGKADDLITELDSTLADAKAIVEGLDGPCRISMAAIYTGPTPAAFVEPVWEMPATAVAVGCALVPGPDQAQPDGNGRAFLSLEQLDLLDAPTLILLTADSVEGERASIDEVAGNPLWQQLPAVVDGTVVELDRLGYAGIDGRIRFANDLVTALQG